MTCTFYWDSGSELWFCKQGTFPEYLKQPARGRLQGATGATSQIKSKVKISNMEIFEVENITSCLASVADTCKQFQLKIIFDNEGVYMCSNHVKVPKSTRIGTFDSKVGLYKVDNNFFRKLKSYQKAIQSNHHTIDLKG